MKTILRMLLTAIAVMVIANFLPGVEIDNFTNALFVAIVLGFLRITIQPLLVILTLPVTILTLGLFLLVINAIIIMLASSFVDGFYVSGFWIALIFSVLLSMLQSILYSFLKEDYQR